MAPLHWGPNGEKCELRNSERERIHMIVKCSKPQWVGLQEGAVELLSVRTDT